MTKILENVFNILIALLIVLPLLYHKTASSQISSGTAFAVAPGLFVTNHHVIDGCDSIDIITNGQKFLAVTVNTDKNIDLALVKTKLISPVAILRAQTKIILGEAGMVFGFPLAGALSSKGNFTPGVVSALQGLNDDAGLIQVTAPVQPGNSGGPLLDRAGLVIGVVRSKLDAVKAVKAYGDIPQNINFGINLENLMEFLTKNQVRFQQEYQDKTVEMSQIAATAQKHTHSVECKGTIKRKDLTYDIKNGRLPPCPGSYNTGNWTNCYGVAPTIYGGEYFGEFKDDQMHGLGIHRLPNGTTFQGDHKENMRHGDGVEHSSTGGIIREGVWRNDRFIN